MTNLTERVAKAIYERFEDRPAYAQTQMSGPLADELAQAALTEIFNYLENPSEAVMDKGAHTLVFALDAESDREDHAVDCWKAMLAQFKEEALGK